MILDEFRAEMWARRAAADKEANARKMSNLAWEWLKEFYRQLDSEERKLANQVLSEWALNDNENVRCDALVLIEDFSVKDALPALRELTARLRISRAPGARYELQKANRILKFLDEAAGVKQA